MKATRYGRNTGDITGRPAGQPVANPASVSAVSRTCYGRELGTEL